MPWIEDERQKNFLQRQIGLDESGGESQGFKEKLRAAYRLENTVGSFFAQESGLPDGFVSGDYDAWADLTDDEKLNQDFLDNAVYADNPLELEALRKQMARENKDRRALADGGFIPTMMSAIVDPVNLIPVGGTTYRTYRTGASILEGAAVTAGAAAIGASASEVGLHHSQITRTYGESAANVAVSALFGSILGAAPGVVRGLIDEKDVAKVMNPEGRIANGENPSFNDGSLSAASVDFDPKVRGELARKVAKWVGFDPLSRSITSDAKATRQIASRLAENPLDMDTPLGQALETRVKVHDGKLYEAFTKKNDVYKEYRSTGGNLKVREFNEEIGKAMRNGSDNPHIQRTADFFRAKVYDPIKKEAIEVRLLPEDVDVTTAESYLNRVWKKEKITKQMPLFVKKVSKWLMDQDEAKQARRLDEIDQDFKVKIEEEVRVKETGEIAKVEVDADKAFRRAKKRRDVVDILRDCLNA